MVREPETRQAWLRATQTDFNAMIRIEASDEHGICTCVTCGVRRLWNDQFHAGHFLTSKAESIRFETGAVFETDAVIDRITLVETTTSCCHPQCHSCNTGNCSHVNRWAGAKKKEEVTIAYVLYMLNRYGQEEIDRLKQLRATSVTWSIDELRRMRSKYKRRFKIAMEERGLEK